jgi:hypothetical protein
VIYGDDKSLAVDVAPRTAPATPSLRRLGASLVAAEAIELVDLRGRVVLRSEPSPSGVRLDLSPAPRGLYVARSGRELLPVVLTGR